MKIKECGAHVSAEEMIQGETHGMPVQVTGAARPSQAPPGLAHTDRRHFALEMNGPITSSVKTGTATLSLSGWI